jgi:hypothetical protein
MEEPIWRRSGGSGTQRKSDRDLGFEVVGVELDDGGAGGVECGCRGSGYGGDEEERGEECGTHGGVAKLLEAGGEEGIDRPRRAAAQCPWGGERVCGPIGGLHVSFVHVGVVLFLGANRLVTPSTFVRLREFFNSKLLLIEHEPKFE